MDIFFLLFSLGFSGLFNHSSFLSQNFLVYTYSETGSLQSESSYVMMHCHYQGYVAESPHSVVTLSVCSGLRGFLQFENISYGIEPLESSARFEHIIYQVKNGNPDVLTFADNYSHIMQKDQLYKFHLSSQEKFISKLLPQYLEMHIVVEKALYPDAISLEGFSVIIAQLLGFNIGLTYDDTNNCSCTRATCVMNQEAVRASGVKIFSNCSMYEYRNFISNFEAPCLQDLSYLQPLYKNKPVCGNGILESNEECDCGNEEECQFKKCCNFKTCKLKGSVKCGSGPCCTSKCEFSVAGAPCRKSTDQECDFTEYCNGTSSHCVPDTYALNGYLCKFGTAYCYNGQCRTTDNQCANIFGKGAQGGPYTCFKEVNSPIERFGNCGFKNSQPLPCEQKDILCGKLTCVWPHKNTYKTAAQYTVYSYIHDHVCLSIIPGSSLSSDGRDNAYVADGTVCGPQMYCVNKTCRETHLMRYNCNATKKCKGNGICNNFGNCQCFPGHRPPDCTFQIGSPGGSIDDGNILKSDLFFLKKGYNAHRYNWLILSFYIFLPFFISFILVIIKRNERRKSDNREKTECEGRMKTVSRQGWVWPQKSTE
ncbi:disintegrin and metalloproteinase domain-containing protein 18 isoform X10 [Marmota marmota marmota]|uniref:disintegrin and metalloproteinase domain-containing protein 18 isoform X10 n=1 Tax=Marmota marmota marmota TaxID=9994 RepID=UPI00209376DA|nr:disintegrin and metalloproteinase domain-containing protein 18 isoform X10 [Marmota marmota marmota]